MFSKIFKIFHKNKKIKLSEEDLKKLRKLKEKAEKKKIEPKQYRNREHLFDVSI